MQKFEFAEMNIVHRGNPNQTLSIVRRAIRMGYDAVVLNIDIGSSLSNNVLNEETKVGGKIYLNSFSFYFFR
jgi:DhnA family fructose-bisphosphate aldolase class Ia